jgi:hypothetical protein
MTTIVLSEAVERNNGLSWVFGNHQDSEDRFVFGIIWNWKTGKTPDPEHVELSPWYRLDRRFSVGCP